MTAKLQTPALDALAKVRAKIAEAERHQGELEAERSKAARAMDRPRAALEAYYEQLGRGEREPDAAEEKRLQRALTAAGESVVAVRADSGGGIVMQDPRHEALVRGAIQAVQDRRDDEGWLIAERQDAVAAEMLDRAEAAHDQLFAGLDAFRAGLGAWSRERRAWLELLPRMPAYSHLGPSEVPPLPFDTTEIERALAPLESGQERDPHRFVPAPRSLVIAALNVQAAAEQEAAA